MAERMSLEPPEKDPKDHHFFLGGGSGDFGPKIISVAHDSL